MPKTSAPTADFFCLRDGKIQTFNSYLSLNARFAPMGINFDFAGAIAKAAAVD